MDTIKNEITTTVGPLYNYADHILDPAKLKVSGKGTIDSLWNDVSGIATYVDTLTFGEKTISKTLKGANQKPLGNKFFIKSGTCGNQSTEQCKGKERFIFINNIPTGKIPCVNNNGIKLPFNSPFKGIIPGLLEDIVKINPITIFYSLAGKGGIDDKCHMRRENVGYQGNYTSVIRCSPSDPKIRCPKKIENFDVQSNNHKQNILIIILIFLLMLFIINITNKKS